MHIENILGKNCPFSSALLYVLHLPVRSKIRYLDDFRYIFFKGKFRIWCFHLSCDKVVCKKGFRIASKNGTPRYLVFE